MKKAFDKHAQSDSYQAFEKICLFDHPTFSTQRFTKGFRKIVCGTAGDPLNVRLSTSREMHSSSLCFTVLMQACREINSVYFALKVKNFANLSS